MLAGVGWPLQKQQSSSSGRVDDIASQSELTCRCLTGPAASVPPGGSSAAAPAATAAAALLLAVSPVLLLQGVGCTVAANCPVSRRGVS